ncbi:PQLC1 [Cordylochernes scorpioides]|uniref:PQLC1 n=1 Tax=Cordylochernes scorpioides TaxID=51811 RepID=A0ABY6LV09_9ARAC|nr:PQLC1 [Cordylochernes scorpioides]
MFCVAEFNTRQFWGWTDFWSYLEFLILFTLFSGMLMYSLLDYSFAIEVVGFLSVFIESLIGLPQFYQNLQNKSTVGMRSHSEPSYCLPGFGGGPGVVNPTPPIEQFLAQQGFWERVDELQYASLEHPTHALLDSGPEIWLANPSFEYSHSGDIH